MGHRTRRGLLLLIAAVGCGVAMPMIQEVGTVIEFGADEGLVPCAGTVAYLDDFTIFVASELGIELPEDTPIRYFWLEQAEIDRICGEGHTGCVHGFEAVANSPMNEHELVHTVKDALPEHASHWLFNEGLAEFLDPSFSLMSRSHYVHDPREFISASHEADFGYDTAGEFTAYLVQRFGFELYVQLLVASEPDDRHDELDAEFQTVYGIDFDAACDAFMNRQGCPAEALMIPPFYCSRPQVEWGVESWQYVSPKNCEDEAALGEVRARESAVTIGIQTPGLYEIESSHAVTTVGSCGGCLGNPHVVAPGYVSRALLTAGRHFVHVQGPGTVEIRAVDETTPITPDG